MPKIFGLIGYPISKSLSPYLHNAAFGALEIKAEYKLFPLKEDELKGFFADLKKNNIHGLNVTVPYKEKVIAFLNKIAPEAELIGAVNTIIVNSNGLEGFNTDGEGFLTHIKSDLGFNPKGKVIVLIGAGGASRAISVYLSREKPKRISFYDVDKLKAENLVKHLKKYFADIEFKQSDSIGGLNIETSDLLINAAPIGMKADEVSPLDSSFLHRGLTVYDLIYNPPETKLLRLAKSKGCLVSNGLGMLLYQGALAFRHFTGEDAPLEVMRQALNKESKNYD
ncbi:MAG: shikimate dehydrogenase [Candidatus Omnitrophota bacterium]|nr:shikimate dehydrogenase [Candidatus Omnitrophota bacterium]